ncbi:MAG TPA: hypothetical protein VKN99_14430 [Polyangia bacterium]|nr:hypothetical protein [Polyangia bacterium]
MRGAGSVCLLIAFVGCGGDFIAAIGAPDHGGGGARGMFERSVQPILDGTCAVCHRGVIGSAGPPFLLPMPDEYSTVMVWPGLVGDSPQSSKLYIKGQHEGPDFTPAQKDLVATWIIAEAMARLGGSDGGASGPTLPPFVPALGSNTRDLSALAPGLDGAALSFVASVSGAGLELTVLGVVAPATTGVHVVHPLFIVLPQSGSPKPDPVDSFYGLDQTVPAGGHRLLGPGTLILTSYKAGDSIAIAFQALAATNPPDLPDGGSSGGGCKNVPSFTANARPQLQNICVTCHGGANPMANAALDMSHVPDDSPTGQAAACAQVRNKVTPSMPATSRIFQVTAPGFAGGHPFQFPDAGSFAAFEQMVSQWIASEQ